MAKAAPSPIFLPLHHPEDLPDPSIEDIEPTRQTHLLASTILLAEDDPAIIHTITSAVQSLGYQIDVAQTGTKFLQQARTNPPQILLLNMQIPEMEGWQVLSILKEDEALQNIPILCFTSLMITGDSQRYADAGASAFLLNPFRIETLLDWLTSQQP